MWKPALPLALCIMQRQGIAGFAYRTPHPKQYLI
jgi:hypothetical protein